MNRKLVRMPLPTLAGGAGADPFFYMPYRAKDSNEVSKDLPPQSSAAVTPKLGNTSIKPATKSVGALLGAFAKKT